MSKNFDGNVLQARQNPSVAQLRLIGRHFVISDLNEHKENGFPGCYELELLGKWPHSSKYLPKCGLNFHYY